MEKALELLSKECLVQSRNVPKANATIILTTTQFNRTKPMDFSVLLSLTQSKVINSGLDGVR